MLVETGFGEMIPAVEALRHRMLAASGCATKVKVSPEDIGTVGVSTPRDPGTLCMVITWLAISMV